MNVKTAHDLISSLRGSAFRRASFDGRTVDLRRIVTLRERMQSRGPGQTDADIGQAIEATHPRFDSPAADRTVGRRHRA